MVMRVGIRPTMVRRVLVDSGSSMNILFKSTFDQMKISMKDVSACQTKIQGFTDEPKQPVGTIELPIELGEGDRRVTLIQTFVIVDEISAYNTFLWRPALADFRIALAQ